MNQTAASTRMASEGISSPWEMDFRDWLWTRAKAFSPASNLTVIQSSCSGVDFWKCWCLVMVKFVINETSFLLISWWSEGWSSSPIKTDWELGLFSLGKISGRLFSASWYLKGGIASHWFLQKVYFGWSHQQCHFSLLWARTAWRINPTRWHCSPAWSVLPQQSSTKIHWRTWALDVHRLSGLFSLEAERKPGDHLESRRQMQKHL